MLQWPVGLKNVGQTCWFSAVIQSLFHIPAFRELVFGFQPPALMPPPNGLSADDKLSKINQISEFMTELRKLFALLLATERKYVDPSVAVDLLRKGFVKRSEGLGLGADNGQQEDISECTHILFEWIEEAFKGNQVTAGDNAKKEESMDLSNAAGESADKSDEVDNPMSALFYGRIQVEGKTLNGEPFSRLEAFTQHALQVNTVSDIHDSIQESTTIGGGSPHDTWFKQLPPVLFFSLSRFDYKPESGAMKIHNRLDFPQFLYMDRYMVENKEVTRQKRKEVQKLKGFRGQLQENLKKFTDYGSGDLKLPLPQVLQYAMDFASPPQSSEAATTDSAAPTMTTVPSTSLMQVDSPCPSPSMTPASSVTCLTTAGAATSTPAKSGEVGPGGDGDGVVPAENKPVGEACEEMDVEMEECAPAETATEEAKDKSSIGQVDQPQECIPRPKHIADLELKVIQVLLH